MTRPELHPDFYEGSAYSLPEQKRLTEELLLPHQQEIIADIQAMRAEVDAALRNDPEIQKHVKLWGKEYPIGFCAEIRNAMLTRMHAEMKNPTRPGMRILREFVRAGGMIRPFWGIDVRMHFQNAIQIGNAILDVANDTVDPTKDPVMFYPTIETSSLKPITSIEQFADICEKYWHHDMYPNIYFPHLAPAYPVLAVMHARRGMNEHARVLMLPVIETELARLNLYTLAEKGLFGSAYNFICKSRYRDKRLSGSMLKLLVEAQPSAAADAAVGEKKAREAFKQFRAGKFNAKTPIPPALLQEAEALTKSGKSLAGTILAGIRI